MRLLLEHHVNANLDKAVELDYSDVGAEVLLVNGKEIKSRQINKIVYFNFIDDIVN